eukprot:238076_1
MAFLSTKINSSQSQKQILFILGYLQIAENTLNLSMKMENGICPIIFSFYFIPIDTFDIAKVEPHNIIENNGDTVRLHKNGGMWCNAYGTEGIYSNTKHKYKWRLTIDKKTTMMWVGIASKKTIDGHGFMEIDYAFEGSQGNAYRLGKKKQYANGYKTGDVVSILVNCDKKEISFSVNSEDYGVAYKIDIRPTYYLAVSIYCLSGQSITINEFCIIEK